MGKVKHLRHSVPLQCKLIWWWSSFISYTQQVIPLSSASSKFNFIATPGSCNRTRRHHTQSTLTLLVESTNSKRFDVYADSVPVEPHKNWIGLITSTGSTHFTITALLCALHAGRIQYTQTAYNSRCIVGHRKRVGAGGPIWIPHRFEVTDNQTRTGKTSFPSAPPSCALVGR